LWGIPGQLVWAITHGMTERVHLLVSHGAAACGRPAAAEVAAELGFDS
jgi:hypothetical protein